MPKTSEPIRTTPPQTAGRGLSGSPSAAIGAAIRNVGRGWIWLDRFVRTTYFGLTAMHVLLGAGLAAQDLSGTQIAWLLLIAVCCHVHIFLGNDVVDLEVDATQPRRAHHPLVKGLRGEGVSKRTAVLLAFAGAVAAFLLTAAAGGGTAAMLALLAAFVGIGAYNLWGKVCPVPPLTDAIEGLGWWGLVFFGAWFVRPELSFEEMQGWLLPLLAFSMGFTVLISGIHGGLRDIVNDLQHRKTTSALFFRATPLGGKAAGSTAAKSSPHVIVFSYAVVIAMFWPSLAFLREPGYFAGPVWHATAVIATATMFVANVALLWPVVRPIEPRRDTWISAHAVVMLLPSLCLYLPSSLLSAPLKWLVTLLFFVPLLLRTKAVEGWLAHLDDIRSEPTAS